MTNFGDDGHERRSMELTVRRVKNYKLLKKVWKSEFDLLFLPSLSNNR